jgi:hypothetical protein
MLVSFEIRRSGDWDAAAAAGAFTAALLERSLCPRHHNHLPRRFTAHTIRWESWTYESWTYERRVKPPVVAALFALNH